MDIEKAKTVTMEELIRMDGFLCSCGKTHKCDTKKVLIASGAIFKLPELLKEAGCKYPFLLSGDATFRAAGDKVCNTLNDAGIKYDKYVFPQSPVLPTEQSVGSAVMHFNRDCDCIVGIGSGVINDIGKLLARTAGKRYLIVATAPSMDGYASATSSMEQDGLKVSLNSTAAWAVIGDLDVLCNAPMHMLHAGVGDMVAKYISLCEWRIGKLLKGEYYCPVIATLVESALKRCVDAGPGLVNREPEAIKAVMEGMVLTGLAMNYAGISRPASGMEHYFSHIWDMRALAFGTQSDLHGIQCGIATLISLKVYEYIKSVTPNKEKAIAAVQAFSLPQWNDKLRAFIGEGAEAMIAGEIKEGKYDKQKHAKRLPIIINKWQEILCEIDKMPTYEQLLSFMKTIGAPTSPSDFGVTNDQVKETFTMTKDIRDKYIASTLLWDLGELEEAIKVL